MSRINSDGRCAACLCFTETAFGCHHCWLKKMSGAAEALLKEDTDEWAEWPELITAHVSEDQLPVFQKLLWSVE